MMRGYSKWTPPSSDETSTSTREMQEDLSAYDISTAIKKRSRDFELFEMQDEVLRGRGVGGDNACW